MQFLVLLAVEVTVLLGLLLGGGGGGLLLSDGLVLSLVLEGRLVRTGLTDGVVGFTLSENSLFPSLIEEA